MLRVAAATARRLHLVALRTRGDIAVMDAHGGYLYLLYYSGAIVDLGREPETINSFDGY